MPFGYLTFSIGKYIDKWSIDEAWIPDPYRGVYSPCMGCSMSGNRGVHSYIWFIFMVYFPWNKQGLGLMSLFGDLFHITKPNICWRWNIPFLVGWCWMGTSIPTPDKPSISFWWGTSSSFRPGYQVEMIIRIKPLGWSSPSSCRAGRGGTQLIWFKEEGVSLCKYKNIYI